MKRLRVLITVKTYPIPSAKYDELVCTAGVREDGSFVRLYPINFRDLDYSKQYRKYQWIEVAAEKHCAFRNIWPPFSGNSGHLCRGQLTEGSRLRREGFIALMPIPKGR